MSDGYDYQRHGGDFPTLRDDEIEALNFALEITQAVYNTARLTMPAEYAAGISSLFLKARHAAAQRKIGPYGG